MTHDKRRSAITLLNLSTLILTLPPLATSRQGLLDLGDIEGASIRILNDAPQNLACNHAPEAKCSHIMAYTIYYDHNHVLACATVKCSGKDEIGCFFTPQMEGDSDMIQGVQISRNAQGAVLSLQPLCITNTCDIKQLDPSNPTLETKSCPEGQFVSGMALTSTLEVGVTDVTISCCAMSPAQRKRQKKNNPPVQRNRDQPPSKLQCILEEAYDTHPSKDTTDICASCAEHTIEERVEFTDAGQWSEEFKTSMKTMFIAKLKDKRAKWGVRSGFEDIRTIWKDPFRTPDNFNLGPDDKIPHQFKVCGIKYAQLKIYCCDFLIYYSSWGTAV